MGAIHAVHCILWIPYHRVAMYLIISSSFFFGIALLCRFRVCAFVFIIRKMEGVHFVRHELKSRRQIIDSMTDFGNLFYLIGLVFVCVLFNLSEKCLQWQWQWQWRWPHSTNVHFRLYIIHLNIYLEVLYW